MPFSTLGLSVATVGMATLAFAIAAPASAQETSLAHPLSPLSPLPSLRPLWRRSSDHRSFDSAGGGAACELRLGARGGRGQRRKRNRPGGGVRLYRRRRHRGRGRRRSRWRRSALFGGPGYTYAPATGYGGPFAAPFNAAGSSPRALPGGRRRWRTPPASYTPAPGSTRAAATPRLGWTVTAISSPAQAGDVRGLDGNFRSWRNRSSFTARAQGLRLLTKRTRSR